MPKRKRNINTRSKSTYFGVRQNIGRSERYQAAIMLHGNAQSTSLGSYGSLEYAAEVYDQEAIKLGRPLEKLNYPAEVPDGYTPKQVPLRANNGSGYRNVSVYAGKFQSAITIDHKMRYFGVFENAYDAAVCSDCAIHKYHKSVSLLNFPNMIHNLDVEPKRKKQKLKRNNSTGYKGIEKTSYGYRARYKKGDVTVSLGTFETAIDAALAFDQAAIKRGHQLYTLNFPDGIDAATKLIDMKQVMIKEEDKPIRK